MMKKLIFKKKKRRVKREKKISLKRNNKSLLKRPSPYLLRANLKRLNNRRALLEEARIFRIRHLSNK
jgi:hypothetical protein